MIFTARNQRSTNNFNSISKDKEEDRVAKKLDKISRSSLADMRLRDAINNKYQKSKIKYFRYHLLTDKQTGQSSKDSSEMSEYQHLKNQRYICLNQYHNREPIKPIKPMKQYMIKLKRSQHKKLNTQENSRSFSKFEIGPDPKVTVHNFQLEHFPTFDSNHRKTLSSEKRESEWLKLGSNNHYSLKKTEVVESKQLQKRAPSQQEPKSRLHYLRKERKSPYTPKYF